MYQYNSYNPYVPATGNNSNNGGYDTGYPPNTDAPLTSPNNEYIAGSQNDPNSPFYTGGSNPLQNQFGTPPSNVGDTTQNTNVDVTGGGTGIPPTSTGYPPPYVDPNSPAARRAAGTYGRNVSGQPLITESSARTGNRRVSSADLLQNPNQYNDEFSNLIQARNAASQAGEAFDPTQYGSRGGTGYNVRPDDYQSGLIGSNQGNKQYSDMNYDGINDSYNNNYIGNGQAGSGTGGTDARTEQDWLDYQNQQNGDYGSWEGRGGSDDPNNPFYRNGDNPLQDNGGWDGQGGGGRPNQDGTIIDNPLSPWSNLNDDGTRFGGQSTTVGDPSAADYDSVRQYSDAAYDDARSYLDPAQDFDRNRMAQDLINKGIDPNSAQGQRMMNNMSQRHGDQNSGAAFDSMGFGQGIQQQMYNQELQRAQQAGTMQMGDWNFKNQMGNLELNRQQQDFNEYSWYNDFEYRVDVFNEDNRRWDQNVLDRYLGFSGDMDTGGMQGTVGNRFSSWDEYLDNIRQNSQGQGG
jgi:hypothetical protein